VARCVLSTILDTDNDDRLVVACVVHTHYAPCPRDGEPANPLAIHADEASPGRAQAIGWWRRTTAGQRPLVIHRGDMTDGTHEIVEDCRCAPEILAAVSP